MTQRRTVPSRLLPGGGIYPVGSSPRRKTCRLFKNQIRQCLPSTSATLTMAIVGSVNGWTTTSLLYLITGTGGVALSLTNSESPWIVSFTALGSMIGSLVAVQFVGRRGRKNCLALCNTMFTLGWFIIYTATSVPVLYLARGILGIGVGIARTINPMYVPEVADINIRGSLSSLSVVNVSIGTLLTCSLGLWLMYESLVRILAIVSFISFLSNMCFPETQYFPVATDETKQERKSIEYYESLINTHKLKMELYTLRAQATHELQPQSTSEIHQPSTSQMHRSSSSEIHQPSTSQLHRSSSSEICADPTCEIHHTSTSEMHGLSTIQIHQPSTSQMHRSSSSEIHQPSTSQMHRSSSSEICADPTCEIHHTSTSEIQRTSTSEIHRSISSEIRQPSTSQMHQSASSEIRQPSTSQMHRSASSEIHQPSTSQMHRSSPSEICADPTCEIHHTSTSEIQRTSRSEIHRSISSKMHQPSTSQMHPSASSEIHQPSTSQMHRSASSEIHQPSTSQMHRSSPSEICADPTSEIHQTSTSEMHRSSTSQIHRPSRSEIHQPSTSQMHRSSSSEINQPSTSQMPRSSSSEICSDPTCEIHRLSTSEMHRSSTIQIHLLCRNEIHQPSTSQIHRPSTSEIHQPSTIQMHRASSREIYPDPTNEIRQPPTSQIHRPSTSEIHSDPTSEIRPDITCQILSRSRNDLSTQSNEDLREWSDTDESDTDLPKYNWSTNLQALLQRSNRKALFIMLGLTMAQQLSGNFITMQYLLVLFGKPTVSIGESAVTLLVLAAGLISGTLSTLTANSVGRRTPLILSTLGLCLTLITLATYLLLVQYKSDVSILSAFPIIDLITYQVMFHIGLGTLPNVLQCELFPTQLKSFVGAIIVIFDGIIGFIAPKLYQVITDNVGSYAIYFIFATSCCLAFLMVFIWVPETKGKTYDEIEALLVGKNLNSLNKGVKTDEIELRRI